MFITQHITYSVYHQSNEYALRILEGHDSDEETHEFAVMGDYQAPFEEREDEQAPLMNQEMPSDDPPLAYLTERSPAAKPKDDT